MVGGIISFILNGREEEAWFVKVLLSVVFKFDDMWHVGQELLSP
mgnify:CR=1 FL=1